MLNSLISKYENSKSKSKFKVIFCDCKIIRCAVRERFVIKSSRDASDVNSKESIQCVRWGAKLRRVYIDVVPTSVYNDARAMSFDLW